jgi:hypothetical protein
MRYFSYLQNSYFYLRGHSSGKILKLLADDTFPSRDEKYTTKDRVFLRYLAMFCQQAKCWYAVSVVSNISHRFGPFCRSIDHALEDFESHGNERDVREG